MMPEMDGIELLKNVRESARWKDLPFVLVTAVSDKDYIVSAKDYGVNGYILKPVTFHRVTAKLQELFPNKVFPKIAG
jgi:two-component system chemotaxis response regulator CheY